jgi:hypothetical protein
MQTRPYNQGVDFVRTNYVLIDFENVQPEMLDVLKHEQFKVIIFVGANQAKIPFEVATAVQSMGDKAEYMKICGNGANALDFHIAYYIGHLAAIEPTAYFHIISKDTGFDPLIQYLNTKKILSSRSKDITDIPLVKVVNSKSPEERIQVVISKFQQPKITKPRTSKTLASAIASYFQKQLSDDEIQAIIAGLISKKFIKIVDGKVSYPSS